MWALLKSLLLKWTLIKAILRALGSLGWLLPLAMLLKAIGLPLLIVLAVLALPLIVVLVVIGLPLVFVVLVGGALLSFALWVASMGLLALKIAIPIVLVVWLLRWLSSRGNDATPDTPAADSGGGTA